MVNAVTDIQEDTTVEIVVKVQPLDDEEVEIRPHSLVVHSYKTPTFCHYCGEMLFGKGVVLLTRGVDTRQGGQGGPGPSQFLEQRKQVRFQQTHNHCLHQLF